MTLLVPQLFRDKVTPLQRVTLSFAGLTIVSLMLFGLGAIHNHSAEFSYLIWNLFLAWLPLGFAVLLICLLQTRLWSSWLPGVTTILWLIFLPNSFYMITDLIHLQNIVRRDLLYDVVMFSSFIVAAGLVGLCSLYIVHRQLVSRFGNRAAALIVAVAIFLCSFAIYLGRDLRWNSWDVLINPAGLLFDISDRLIHPLNSSALFRTTISFFVLISSMYLVAWQLIRAVRSDQSL